MVFLGGLLIVIAIAVVVGCIINRAKGLPLFSWNHKDSQ
jgi:hypothetical protein